MKFPLRFRLQQIASIAADIVPKLPIVGDNPLTLIVKGLAMYKSINKLTQGGKGSYKIIEMLGGSKHYINPHFVKMFFSTKIQHTFNLSTVAFFESERSNLILARKGPISLFFIEYYGGVQPEYAEYFWSNKEFDFRSLLDEIWALYPSGLHVGFEKTSPYKGLQARFSSVAMIAPDRFVGNLEWKFQEFLDKQQQYASDGVSRTHLFWGPPGTGKTIFALRAAREMQGRLIFMTAESIKQSREISFLLNNLAPDCLVVDDLDKIDLNSNLPDILNLLTEIKARQPRLVVLLTANSLGFDPALKRADVLINGIL